MKSILPIAAIASVTLLTACTGGMSANQQSPQPTESSGWHVDFFDDFDSYNSDNWQDQMIWVNNEEQCYVPNGEFGTREVSDGSLKLKVINVGERTCDNLDKHGKQHPDTQYLAGRIISKNLQEFVKGKWTAKLRVPNNGQASMFPAWWILGAQNDEPPAQLNTSIYCIG